MILSILFAATMIASPQSLRVVNDWFLAANERRSSVSVVYLGFTNQSATGMSGGDSSRQQANGPFTLSSSGTLTNIAAYCSANGLNISAAIYLPGVNGDRPGPLVATNTSTVSGPSSAAWVNIPMNVSLNATQYFIAVWANGVATWYSTTVGVSGTNYVLGATSGTWPAWGSTYSFNTISSNKVGASYGVVVSSQ